MNTDVRVTVESGDDASGGRMDATNRYAYVDIDSGEIELRVRVATSGMADKIAKLFTEAGVELKALGR